MLYVLFVLNYSTKSWQSGSRDKMILYSTTNASFFFQNKFFLPFFKGSYEKLAHK